MKNQNFGKLKNIISNFKGKNILIIGDLILDEFIWGTVSRISPEAPVPVVWVNNESFMPGGAANVANNITSLGANAYLAGIVGNDERGPILKGELSHKGINTEGIMKDSSRPTTLKTRVIAHQQQVVRIDRETPKRVSEGKIKSIVKYVTGIINDMDAVIIEDYGKGLITPTLLKPIVKIAKKHKKIIAVDPKEEHLSYYKNSTVVTPNHHEASKATNVKIKDNESLLKAGNILLKKLKTEIALVTLGEKGMAVFQVGKKPKKIPTIAQAVYDVSGAGDTVISTFTLALAAGASSIQAAHISNCAGGIVVGKVGISIVEIDELINRIKQEITQK